MSGIQYTVKTTSRFRKDFKLARRRGLDAGLFKQVVSILSEGGTHCPTDIMTMRLQAI